MLAINDTQLSALKTDRRNALADRINDWLLTEDSDWRKLDPARRKPLILEIMDYADQSGMRSERDYAVFVRASLLLRMGWKAFIEQHENREMLLEERVQADSKLRAWFTRCEREAKRRAAQPKAPAP